MIYILEEVVSLRSLSTARIPLLNGRPVSPNSISKPSVDAVTEINLNPPPTFPGLRHTWKTDARLSGLNPEVREAIVGPEIGLKVYERGMVR